MSVVWEEEEEEEEGEDVACEEMVDALCEENLRVIAGCLELSEVKEVELCVDSAALSGAFVIGDRLPNLLRLKLNNSLVSSFRDLGTGLRHLNILWMARSGVCDLEGVAALPCLEELYLAFNDISDVSPLALHENLQVLDLESNCIEDADETLSDLATCPTLHCLSLQSNPLCRQAAREQGRGGSGGQNRYRRLVCHHLPQLQVLDDEDVCAADQQPLDDDPLLTAHYRRLESDRNESRKKAKAAHGGGLKDTSALVHPLDTANLLCLDADSDEDGGRGRKECKVFDLALEDLEDSDEETAMITKAIKHARHSPRYASMVNLGGVGAVSGGSGTGRLSRIQDSDSLSPAAHARRRPRPQTSGGGGGRRRRLGDGQVLFGREGGESTGRHRRQGAFAELQEGEGEEDEEDLEQRFLDILQLGEDRAGMGPVGDQRFHTKEHRSGEGSELTHGSDVLFAGNPAMAMRRRRKQEALDVEVTDGDDNGGAAHDDEDVTPEAHTPPDRRSRGEGVGGRCDGGFSDTEEERDRFAAEPPRTSSLVALAKQKLVPRKVHELSISERLERAREEYLRSDRSRLQVLAELRAWRLDNSVSEVRADRTKKLALDARPRTSAGLVSQAYIDAEEVAFCAQPWVDATEETCGSGAAAGAGATAASRSDVGAPAEAAAVSREEWGSPWAHRHQGEGGGFPGMGSARATYNAGVRAVARATASAVAAGEASASQLPSSPPPSHASSATASPPLTGPSRKDRRRHRRERRNHSSGNQRKRAGKHGENGDADDVVTTGAGAGEEGAANGMSDCDLMALLQQRPKNVPELRTRESFRRFFRGMDKSRLKSLLRSAYAEIGLDDEQREAKVSKRLALLS